MARLSRSTITLTQTQTVLDMPTEKQVAANRRNARRSTGPRSSAGKMRASQNSYRHGLATSGPYAEIAERIERLARMIAGDTEDVVALECARTVAQAEFDLAQVQRVKLALISGQIEVGAREAVSESGCFAEELQHALAELIKVDRYERRARVNRDRAMSTRSDLKKMTRSSCR
jgi:hypothetical protein